MTRAYAQKHDRQTEEAKRMKEVHEALRRAEAEDRITSEHAHRIDENLREELRKHGYDHASLRAFASELRGLVCVTPDKLEPGDRVFDSDTQRWHEVDETWVGDGLHYVGWVEGPHVFYHPKLRVPRLRRPSDASSALSDMLRRQAPPPGGVLGGWYILQAHEDKTTRDIGEGPWDTEEVAREFAENEVGVWWILFHAPDATERAFAKERLRDDFREEEAPDPRTDWYVLKVNKKTLVASLTGGGPWSEAEARAFGRTLKGRWALLLAPVGTATAFKKAARG
jgi:hypothetical protein